MPAPLALGFAPARVCDVMYISLQKIIKCLMKDSDNYYYYVKLPIYNNFEPWRFTN